jgi:hypothetical protein
MVLTPLYPYSLPTADKLDSFWRGVAIRATGSSSSLDAWVAAQPPLSPTAKAAAEQFWQHVVKAHLQPYLGDGVLTTPEKDPGFQRWQHCEPSVHELREPASRGGGGNSSSSSRRRG